MYYRAFGNSVVIVNSAKVADDLLEKRGAIYSSRPARTMLRELYVVFLSVEISLIIYMGF